jgi:hypothetical protein
MRVPASASWAEGRKAESIAISLGRSAERDPLTGATAAIGAGCRPAALCALDNDRIALNGNRQAMAYLY